MDILEDKTKKAIKEHRCTLCGETILTGSEYISQTIVDSGEFWHCKFHKECFEYINSKGSFDEITEDMFDFYLEDDALEHNIKIESKLDAARELLSLYTQKNDSKEA